MNGPDHYRCAEQRISDAYRAAPNDAAFLMAEAQVHATLALAAATIHGSGNNGSGASFHEWWEATR